MVGTVAADVVGKHGGMNGILGILYHDVFRSGTAPYGHLGQSAAQYHVDDVAFGRQLEALCASGLPTLDLEAINRSIDSQSSAPAAFVCFDDGWRGTFEVAAPMLADKGVPALAFVTTDFVGRPLFADAATLREAVGGPLTIGCHGRSHRMLSSLARAELRSELQDARRRLEDWTGVEVRALSIPGGATSNMVRTEAREAGFTTVFDSTIGLAPSRHRRSGVGRIGVRGDTSDETFARWLRGDLSREWRRKAILSLPKRLLGMRAYSQLRRFVLGERGQPGEHLFEP
jgi:peptidoglycan/xylan/chitin deacetylase (PgdA/CDA1 family)